jgi:hypothetical protein
MISRISQRLNLSQPIQILSFIVKQASDKIALAVGITPEWVAVKFREIGE